MDDFSRFTWVKFLRFKSETFGEFKSFVVWVERKTASKLLRIHSDHGREFENEDFETFCDQLGIE